MLLGVGIGIQQSSYTTPESASVTICVLLTSGTTAISVPFTLSTSPSGNAQGKTTHIIVQINKIDTYAIQLAAFLCCFHSQH